MTSSHEPSELSQWRSHNDSTINIGICIIISWTDVSMDVCCVTDGTRAR